MMTDAEIRYRRWRRVITVIGSVILGLDALLVWVHLSFTISRRNGEPTGLFSPEIFVVLLAPPLALLSLLIGLVLVVERGGGRFSVGIPLLAFALVTLFEIVLMVLAG
jgi:hypothetical protein